MQKAQDKHAAQETRAILSALRTLTSESAGIQGLKDAMSGDLGTSFQEAVARIGKMSGRLIVSGMGKSGHVGSKIAATLASTGTPSFFVHPAEAGHGDLGMVAADDIILALSWSGETVELRNLVSYSRRFRVPLIAVTSNIGSALAQAAEIVLPLPVVAEACPHGLAPTTSAIVQLALGDALAIALLESRGFSARDFHTFHPAGTLGASLTHIRDIMHSGDDIPLVETGAPVAQAIQIINDKGFGCVGVVDPSGRLAGIVTDGDIRRQLSSDLLTQPVETIMTPDPRTIQPDELVAGALALLNRSAITALMVVEDERPAGIVHMHDFLRIGTA